MHETCACVIHINLHTLSAACALVLSFYINVVVVCCCFFRGGGLHVLRSHCLSCHVVFLSFLTAKTDIIIMSTFRKGANWCGLVVSRG